MSNDSLWQSGLSRLDCHVTDEQLTLLKKYVDLLNRWNKTYNLTAVREPRDMIPLHIFDSLVVRDFIKGDNCLDVGSGAGLPTIPLAIMQPNRQFTALDTNGKKTRFIQQAIIELGLKNANVVHSRIEEWHSPKPFNAIISRAFASVYDFLTTAKQHLADDGLLYAMKGQYPAGELQYLSEEFTLNKTHALNVPNVEGERHLLEFSYKR